MMPKYCLFHHCQHISAGFFFFLQEHKVKTWYKKEEATFGNAYKERAHLTVLYSSLVYLRI